MDGKVPFMMFTLYGSTSVWLTMHRPGDRELVKANEKFIYSQVMTMKVGEARAFQLAPEDVESRLTVRRTE
jgi:hypothetical protein